MDTEITFDTDGLIARVAQASVKTLRRMGAYVRRVAQSKVRTSEKPSMPGTAPHTRRGQLRRALLFGVIARERRVLIGPSAAIVGESASAHEFGGRYKAQRYPRRPFMGPALKDSSSQFAKMWQDAVK